MKDSQAARAMAKAIEKYHETQGWRKELRSQEYWYSDAASPTPEELFEGDQGLACESLGNWWGVPTELLDALWLFVPEERREEVLHFLRERRPSYTPRV